MHIYTYIYIYKSAKMYKFVLVFFSFIVLFTYLFLNWKEKKKCVTLCVIIVTLIARICEDFATTKCHPLPFFSKIILELQDHFG